MKIDSKLNSERGALNIDFDDKVKLNPIFKNNYKEKIKAFLNGTCEKTEFKYQVDLVKDRLGWESVRISYSVDFNIPANS